MLFVLCSLLPVTILALASVRGVTNRLIELARDDLRQGTKLAGMHLIQQLSQAESDLEMLSVVLRDESSESDPTRHPKLLERLLQRFTGLVVVNESGDQLTSLGETEGCDPPEATGSMKTIVTAGTGRDGRPDVVMTFRFTTRGAAPRAITARLDPDHLFQGDESSPDVLMTSVLHEDGTILHSTAGVSTPRTELDRARAQNRSTGTFDWTDEQGASLAAYWTVFAEPQFGLNMLVLQSRRESEVLEPLRAFRLVFLNVVGLTLAIVIYVCLTQIRRSLGPIDELRAATDRLSRGDYAARVHIESGDEFEALGTSFNAMASDLARRIEMLHHLNRIGIGLSAERDDERLLRLVVHSSRNVLGASGCAVHLEDESGGLVPAVIEFGDVAAGSDVGERLAASLSAGADRTIATGRAIEERLGAHAASTERTAVLSIPMRNHEDESIGVLQVIRTDDAVGAFSADDRTVAESLASQAAVALTKNRLAREFQRLFDALAELIATAIDEKSPYTGQHCRRVPILTMMLAEEVCAAKTGPFGQRHLTDDELYELKVAALLHDCGKVTTPVHVVDKATKLETIADRIGLVEVRFEIVRREQRLRALESVATSDPPPVDAFEAELDDALAFVRRCNVGGEFMRPEDQARIREIADRYTWTDAAGTRRSVLTDDEVDNLMISRGTLTNAEREVINHHVVATTRMLEQLPYPRRLRSVPYIAGAHHERMDGKGYPHGLNADQLTLQARILGLADVFEALTAADRPYKKGKTLSESLRILGFMAEEGHVDPDLFRLFVDRGIHVAYGRRFLQPSQVDEVDLGRIPGYHAIVKA